MVNEPQKNINNYYTLCKKLKYILRFTAKLALKMLTHHFLDKLEMTTRHDFLPGILAISSIAAD